MNGKKAKLIRRQMINQGLPPKILKKLYRASKRAYLKGETFK